MTPDNCSRHFSFALILRIKERILENGEEVQEKGRLMSLLGRCRDEALIAMLRESGGQDEELRLLL